MTLEDQASFHTLQGAVRAGRYNALKHFNKRAAERGFTVEQAVEVLGQDGALAWHERGSYWLITEPLQAEPGHQLHIRVKLTMKGSVLLITGWLANQQKQLRRWADRQVKPEAA